MVAAPCWGCTTLSPTLYRDVALPGLGAGVSSFGARSPLREPSRPPAFAAASAGGAFLAGSAFLAVSAFSWTFLALPLPLAVGLTALVVAAGFFEDCALAGAAAPR